MSETIKRVAKAIHESLGYETPWKTCTQCEDAARAAIEAMRMPTDEMIEAAHWGSAPGEPNGFCEMWDNAIDAALKEQTK